MKNPFSGPEEILSGSERRYETAGDAQMRLAEGFVTISGVFAYIFDFNPSGVANIRSYDSKFDGSIHMNDVRIDLASPPLGWANAAIGPVYMSRTASRQQKQSLRPGTNMFLQTPLWKENSEGVWGHVAWTEWRKAESGISNYDIGASVMGIFPTISEALKKKQGGALSQEWALNKTERGVLVFNGTTSVGYYSERRGTFRLISDTMTKTREKSLTALIAQSGGYYGIESITRTTD